MPEAPGGWDGTWASVFMWACGGFATLVAGAYVSIMSAMNRLWGRIDKHEDTHVRPNELDTIRQMLNEHEDRALGALRDSEKRLTDSVNSLEHRFVGEIQTFRASIANLVGTVSNMQGRMDEQRDNRGNGGGKANF